jgi:hypothetical protein
MRVPQVSERIKEAPAQALRGVFAGIGQLLLITDKLRNKTSASQQVPPARAPEPSQTRADTAPAPAPVSSAPSAPAPSAPAPSAPAPSAPAAAAPASAAAVSAPAPAVAAPAASAPAAARVPAARNFDKTGNVRLLTSAEAAADAKASAPAPAARAAEAAPLPNYDELSIASLRARLRNLNPTELRQLVGYEQAHADRADVIAMFERRIAKLEDETSADKRGEAEAEAEIEAREDVEAEVQDDVGAEEEGEE